jgi:uncharacterized damage-inducible protein DinB
MNEIDNIVDQAKRSYEGGAWHGPSLGELLADVSASQAAQRPLHGAHTIWENVLHIAHWQSIVSRRLKGESVSKPEEGDWLPVNDTSPAAWTKALERLASAQQQLITQISEVPESRLQQTAPGTDYSVYYMLHGIVQHNLYHAGQIALLKKA